MELLAVNHDTITDKPSSSASSSELNQRMGDFGMLEDNFRESVLQVNSKLVSATTVVSVVVSLES